MDEFELITIYAGQVIHNAAGELTAEVWHVSDSVWDAMEDADARLGQACPHESEEPCTCIGAEILTFEVRARLEAVEGRRQYRLHTGAVILDADPDRDNFWLRTPEDPDSKALYARRAERMRAARPSKGETK